MVEERWNVKLDSQQCPHVRLKFAGKGLEKRCGHDPSSNKFVSELPECKKENCPIKIEEGNNRAQNKK